MLLADGRLKACVFSVVASLGLFLFSLKAFGLVHVDISSGPEKMRSLAICALDGFDDKEKSQELFEKADEFRDVVENDLVSAGFFKVEMNNPSHCNGIKALSQDGGDSMFVLDQKGVDYLAIIDVVSSGDGASILLQVLDIRKEDVVSEIGYQVPNGANTRKMAHFVADSIMRSITGINGYFNSKIMFVSFDEKIRDKKGLNRKVSIMDQDGYGLADLTSNSLVMRPSYVESLKNVAYVIYNDGLPKIRFLDVLTGKYNDMEGFVSSLDGRVISPKVSPDGRYLVFSLMKGYFTDIYRFEIKTRKIKKLTNGGINVSPSFSPYGDKIVYNSDVSGVQSLHIMNIDGSGNKKITSKHNYSEPAWSPDGNWIAFTTPRKRKFYIGIIRVDGSQERLLYNAYLAESPSWSPNGQQLIFSVQENSASYLHKLKVISVSGREIRTINAGVSALDPYWFNP